MTTQQEAKAAYHEWQKQTKDSKRADFQSYMQKVGELLEMNEPNLRRALKAEYWKTAFVTSLARQFRDGETNLVGYDPFLSTVAKYLSSYLS